MTAFQASTNSAGQPPIWFRTSNQICPPKMWSQWFLNAVFAARGMTKRPVSLSRGIGLHLPLHAHAGRGGAVEVLAHQHRHTARGDLACARRRVWVKIMGSIIIQN